MKFSRIGLIIIFLVSIFLGLFLIPDFQLEVGGRAIIWPGIDSTSFPEFRLGDFRRGEGLYNSHRTYSSATYADLNAAAGDFAADVNIIRRRLDLAGMANSRVTSRTEGSERGVLIEMPSYYSESDLTSLSEWATATGKLEFWQHSQDESVAITTDTDVVAQLGDYRPISSTLTRQDIVSVNVESRAQLGGVLLNLNLTEDGVTKVLSTSASSGQPLLLSVDGEVELMLLNIQQTGNPQIVGLPLLSDTSAAHVRFLGAYLSQLELKGNFTPAIGYNSVPGEFVPENQIFLAAMVMMPILAATAYVGMRYSRQYTVVFFAATVFIQLFFWGLIKFSLVNLSVFTILAAAFVELLTIILVHRMLASSVAWKTISRSVYILCGLVFVAGTILVVWRMASGFPLELIAVFTTWSIATVVGIWSCKNILRLEIRNGSN